MPDYEWLSRRWLRSWLARWSTVTAEALDPRMWADPRVRRAYPDADEAYARVQKLAAAQEDLVGALERVPHSLAHLDVYSRNVISAPDSAQVTLIDWAFVGRAALGEEVAQLVVGTLLFGDADRHAAREIGSACLASYLEGLADAGWTGDPQLVRFGYAAAAALRWGIGWVRNVARFATAADERRARIERETGQTLEGSIAAKAALATYLLELGDEAIELRRVVPSL